MGRGQSGQAIKLSQAPRKIYITHLLFIIIIIIFIYLLRKA